MLIILLPDIFHKDFYENLLRIRIRLLKISSFHCLHYILLWLYKSLNVVYRDNWMSTGNDKLEIETIYDVVSKDALEDLYEV